MHFLFLIVVFEVGEVDGRGGAMLCGGGSNEGRAKASRMLARLTRRPGAYHSLAGASNAFQAETGCQRLAMANRAKPYLVPSWERSSPE